MKRIPPPGSTVRARANRKTPTVAEQALWALIRAAFPEARFRRQVPLRSYIADFASHREKLVVEADGGQHRAEQDADRTAAIEAEGYHVLRFWNHDILVNPDGVAQTIAQFLTQPHPHPPTR